MAAAATAAPAPALAPIRPAGDCRSDQLAAVAVLVDVRGQVVLGVLKIAPGVLLVEAAVLAVLDHPERAGLGQCRQRQGEQADAENRLRCSANHGRVSLLRTGPSGGAGP